MRASAASMGGTTLAMMIASTFWESMPVSSSKWRRRTPHSSAVCSWTVRSRQLAVSFPNSNAPMVTFVLPASSANSTHTSRENDLVRAVVNADHQEPAVVEPRCGALQDGATLPHRYTLATGVTGAEREEIDDGRWSVIDETLDIAVYRRKESDEQLFPRMHMSGFDA